MFAFGAAGSSNAARVRRKDFRTLTLEELRDALQVAVNAEGSTEAAVVRLMQQYNFEIIVLKQVLSEKGLVLDFSRAKYGSIARKVGLDASFSMQDIPTFPLHRARLPTPLFRMIVEDMELAVKQFGLAHEHDTERTRSRFLAPLFARITAQFKLLFQASVDNAASVRSIANDRIQTCFKMLGQTAVVLVENKVQESTGHERLDAMAHVICEAIACDFVNYELGFEPTRIYIVVCDGTAFDFFRYDGSSSPRFARGIQNIPNGFPKTRFHLLQPETGGQLGNFILSMRPICEVIYYFFLLGYEACLDTYCSDTLDTNPESIIHRMRRALPWSDARTLAKQALYLAIAGSEAIARGDIETAEQTAQEGITRLRESVDAVPGQYRREDCNLMQAYDDEPAVLLA